MKARYIILFIFMLILTLKVAVATPQQDLYNNAIIYNPLQEASFPLLDAVNNLHFDNGDFGAQEDGILLKGQDLEFDNTEFVTTNTTSLIETQNVTVSCWFKMESHNNHGTIFSTIEDAGSTDADGVQCNIQKSGGGNPNKIQCYTYNNDVQDTWLSTSELIDAVWYHLVYTFNESSGDARVYINASVDGSVTFNNIATVGYDSGLHKLWLGETNINNGLGNYFDGLIDECYYGGFVADSSHVNFLYNSGSPSSNQQYPFGIFANNAPNITNPLILPATSKVNSTLNCSFNVSDPDGDEFNVSVLFGGQSFNLMGFTSNTFLNFTITTGFSKGDNVTCDITSMDNNSNSVNEIIGKVIQNTAPRSFNITYPTENLTIYGLSNINVDWICEDDDGDTKTGYFYLNDSFKGSSVYPNDFLLSGLSSNYYKITGVCGDGTTNTSSLIRYFWLNAAISTTGFSCEYDSTPYIRESFGFSKERNKIEWVCSLPNKSASYDCFSYVKYGNTLIQANPTPEFVDQTGIIETFSSYNGIVKPYFLDEDLRNNKAVNFTVFCSGDDGTVVNFTTEVIPTYKEPYEIIDRGAWVKDNMTYFIGAFMLLLLFIGAGILIIKKITETS